MLVRRARSEGYYSRQTPTVSLGAAPMTTLQHLMLMAIHFKC